MTSESGSSDIDNSWLVPDNFDALKFLTICSRYLSCCPQAKPMTIRTTLDHIAFLVTSLDDALEEMDQFDLEKQAVQSFPGEGTRECYLGAPSLAGRLLLIESAGDGPYEDALARRGPGLHHVALAVEDLDGFIAQVVCASPWLVHPRSFETRQQVNTIWLARPGVETLVECMEVNELSEKAHAVEHITIAGLDIRDGLASIFGDVGIGVSAGPRSGVTVNDRFIGSP